MGKDLYRTGCWWHLNYDGRKRLFKGISKADFEKAKIKHFERSSNKFVPDIYAARREDINFFSSIPYTYSGDGMDDYSMYQRPSSNGIGYVAICKGERGNNYYTEDKILVAYLTKKYNKANG